MLCGVGPSRPTAAEVCAAISICEDGARGSATLREQTATLLKRYLHRSGHPPDVPDGMVSESQLQRDAEYPEDVRPTLFVLSAYGMPNFTPQTRIEVSPLHGYIHFRLSLLFQLVFLHESTLATSKGQRVREVHLYVLAV